MVITTISPAYCSYKPTLPSWGPHIVAILKQFIAMQKGQVIETEGMKETKITASAVAVSVKGGYPNSWMVN